MIKENKFNIAERVNSHAIPPHFVRRTVYIVEAPPALWGWVE